MQEETEEVNDVSTSSCVSCNSPSGVYGESSDEALGMSSDIRGGKGNSKPGLKTGKSLRHKEIFFFGFSDA